MFKHSPLSPNAQACLVRHFEKVMEYHKTHTRGFDAFTMSVWFALIRTFVAIESNSASRVQSAGLTLPGMNVLSTLRLYQAEGLPLHVLSQYLTVTRANVTGLMDHLVRKGFVRRLPHPSDRRIRLAQLTPKGEAWLDVFLPRHFGAVKKILAPLSAAERRTLIRLLDKIRAGALTVS